MRECGKKDGRKGRREGEGGRARIERDTENESVG